MTIWMQTWEKEMCNLLNSSGDTCCNVHTWINEKKWESIIKIDLRIGDEFCSRSQVVQKCSFSIFCNNSNNNIRKVYSLKFIDIPNVFLMPCKMSHCINAIQGHCCTKLCSNNDFILWLMLNPYEEFPGRSGTRGKAPGAIVAETRSLPFWGSA